MIRPPHTGTGGQLVIDLGAADWAHAALLQTAGTAEVVKEEIRRQIRETSKDLPDHLKSEDPLFNGQNVGFIAVQIAILTADGFTLLRKRGRQVHRFYGAWDVSFSGFCGSDAVSLASGEPYRLELQKTVERELLHEIGASWADARNLWFTGLYRDLETNNMVIMGYLEVPHKKEALISILTDENVVVAEPFPTTREATEVYVRDYLNLIVEFDGSSISAALRRAQPPESASSPFIAPVARATLLLALSAKGKSTKALEK